MGSRSREEGGDNYSHASMATLDGNEQVLIGDVIIASTTGTHHVSLQLQRNLLFPPSLFLPPLPLLLGLLGKGSHKKVELQMQLQMQ